MEKCLCVRHRKQHVSLLSTLTDPHDLGLASLAPNMEQLEKRIDIERNHNDSPVNVTMWG